VESDWNKPIAKSAKPTQASVSTYNGPDPGHQKLLPVTAGVLLVGLSGLSFAWWGRNRRSSH
jgi:hypothetical protein